MELDKALGIAGTYIARCKILGSEKPTDEQIKALNKAFSYLGRLMEGEQAIIKKGNMMTIKVCELCKIEYKMNHPKQKYCSNRCKMKAHRIRTI